MSTGMLHRATARLRTRSASAPLFVSPLPPFHVAFPSPGGHDHPLYELHRAANRIYHERREVYRAKGAELAAADLVAFIREDVASNLSAVMKLAIGPIEIPYFAFLNPRKLWAWFPPHQAQVAQRVAEFRKLYRRRRKAA